MGSESAAPAAWGILATPTGIPGACPAAAGADGSDLRGSCRVAGAANYPPAAAGRALEGSLVGGDCVAAIAEAVEAVGHR
jgi:hypothetical protein